MSKISKRGSRNVMLPGAHRQVHARAAGHAIYWYAWRGGPQIARFAGETLADAETAELAGAAEIAAGYARETRPAAADGTVAKAITAFMQSPLWASYADKTRIAWAPWLHQARDKWGHLSGPEFASEETAEAVGAWIEGIEAASPASAVKAKEAVSRFCSWSRHRTRKLLPRDCKPTAELETTYVRPVQLPPARAAVLDAIATLPALASAICDIALHSGLRRSDMVLLSDPQVDEGTGIIRLGTRKGRRHRRVAVIDLTPSLLAAIHRAQAIRDALYARKVDRARRRGLPEPVKPLTVIVNARCMPFTANGLYQHVRDAFEAAAKARINPHAFRRASATQKHLNGLSWARVGRELGWSEKEAEAMGAIYAPEEGVQAYTSKETRNG